MEEFREERVGEKEAHGTGKKPYVSPTLTVHGDVDEITEFLRGHVRKKEELSALRL